MCNGICQFFKVNPCYRNGSMYEQGFKRCHSNCKVWLKEEDCLRNGQGQACCPCCKAPVRNSPRSKKLVSVVRI